MRVLGRFPEEVTLDRCLASDGEGDSGTKAGTSLSSGRKADVANSSREDSVGEVGLENENLLFFSFGQK